MADTVDDSPLVGPFVVLCDHLGLRRWSRDFETLSEAGECFDRVTRSMGRPERVDGRYSFWYEYGAHGERVRVVHSAIQFRDAMKHATDYIETIRLMGRYGVDLEATEAFQQKFKPKFDDEGYEIGGQGEGMDRDTTPEEEEEEEQEEQEEDTEGRKRRRGRQDGEEDEDQMDGW